MQYSAYLRWSRATLIVMCSFVAASCTRETASRTGVTEISYWRTLTGPAGDAQDELAERFNSSQNAVHVNVEFQGSYSDLATKLMTSSVSRRGPEVTQLGTFEIREFARAGVLVDLAPFVDGGAGIDTSDWPGTMLEAGRVEGGLYWLPFNVSVPLLYYNPEAFRESGIDSPPATWNEFVDDARRLTRRDAAGAIERHGVALWNNTWPLLSWIWSEGGELTDRNYTNITLDDPIVIEVLSTIQALLREGAAVMPDAASGGHRSAFMNGRAAMILDSPAPYAEIAAGASGFEPMVALYPSGRAGRIYAPGGGGLAMLSTTERPKRAAAWEFIRWMLAPESLAFYAEQTGYAAFSESSRSAAGGWIHDEKRAIIHEALPYLRGDFSVTMSPAVRNAFDNAFRRIVIEDIDPATALREADAEAERNIQEEL